MSFNFTQIDLTQLLVAIITVLGGIAVRYLVPLLKEKLSKEQQETLTALAKIGVYAAEQLIIGSGKGAEKKAYVENLLLENGYNIDLDAVDAAIEAAVKDMNIEMKK